MQIAVMVNNKELTLVFETLKLTQVTTQLLSDKANISDLMTSKGHNPCELTQSVNVQTGEWCST